MQSGELIVTGRNHISIPLNRYPNEIKVHFVEHEHDPVPCNPGEADFLEYELRSSMTVSSGFVLHIAWNVSSVREIKWHVFF